MAGFTQPACCWCTLHVSDTQQDHDDSMKAVHEASAPESCRRPAVLGLQVALSQWHVPPVLCSPSWPHLGSLQPECFPRRIKCQQE